MNLHLKWLYFDRATRPRSSRYNEWKLRRSEWDESAERLRAGARESTRGGIDPREESFEADFERAERGSSETGY